MIGCNNCGLGERLAIKTALTTHKDLALKLIGRTLIRDRRLRMRVHVPRSAGCPAHRIAFLRSYRRSVVRSTDRSNDRSRQTYRNEGRSCSSGLARYTRPLLDEVLDLLEVVVEGVDHGPKLLQEVFGAEEGDAQLGGGEVDAGRQLAEAGAHQGFGGAVPGHLLMLAAGGADDAVEVLFEAIPARDLGGAALLDEAELGDEALPPADQAAAGAVVGAAAFQNAPGGPFADAQGLLERAAVDGVGRKRLQGGDARGEAVDVSRDGRHRNLRATGGREARTAAKALKTDLDPDYLTSRWFATVVANRRFWAFF